MKVLECKRRVVDLSDHHNQLGMLRWLAASPDGRFLEEVLSDKRFCASVRGRRGAHAAQRVAGVPMCDLHTECEGVTHVLTGRLMCDGRP